MTLMLLSVLKNIKIVEPGVIISSCTRIINTWNSLPGSVISTSTTDPFKNKLDKFWSTQDLLYNYKVELTGIGNRSFINNLD